MKSTQLDNLIIELARRRLKEDIEHGMVLSHDWILKKSKDKPFGDKYGGFKWCTRCEGFAWGLGSACPTVYKEKLQEYITVARNQVPNQLLKGEHNE